MSPTERPIVVTIDGPFLDAGNRATVLAAVQQAMGKARLVVIDLCQVKFMDSSGMGSLLALADQLERRGGILVLARPTDPVSSAFGIVYMNRKVVVHDDLDSALAAARNGLHRIHGNDTAAEDGAELLQDIHEAQDVRIVD